MEKQETKTRNIVVTREQHETQLRNRPHDSRVQCQVMFSSPNGFPPNDFCF